MNEKLRKAAETLWQDETDFFRVLSVLGIKEVIKSLRSPLQFEDNPTFHNFDSRNLPTARIDTETTYPLAA